MKAVAAAVVCVLAVCVLGVAAGLKPGECEVCIKVVDTIRSGMDKKDLKNKEKVLAKLRSYCKTAKDRENRFCYYIGGTEDAATGLLNVIADPVVNGLPTDKICERTKSKDLQICELRYSKASKGPVAKEDLQKMRVGELKAILSDLGGECNGCSDKSEFVTKIVALQNAKTGKKEL